MATVTPQAPAQAAPPTPETEGHPEGVPYRLSADDYFRMVEAEIIPPARRVGLWEGQLYEKMAKKLPHAGASSKVLAALFRALPEGWCLWPENPILVDDFTAPLPDFAVVRGSPDDYTRRRAVPKSGEIGLVIEVAEASLRKNLTETLQTYARAGLPAYWVVNLVERRVEVFSDPLVEGDVARYAESVSRTEGQDVPLVLDGREAARIPVRDLLPVVEAS